MATAVAGDQQDTELGRLVVLAYAEHATDPMPVDFGKPRTLAVGVMISREVGDDASNQHFEFGVPAEFRRVLLAMRHHNPTKITWHICLSDDDGRSFGVQHASCSLAPTDTTVSVKCSWK